MDTPKFRDVEALSTRYIITALQGRRKKIKMALAEQFRKVYKILWSFYPLFIYIATSTYLFVKSVYNETNWNERTKFRSYRTFVDWYKACCMEIKHN